MNSISMKSFAKINLSLDILGKLDNGYHEVKMVMQTVSLYDVVVLEKKDHGIELSSNVGFLPSDSSNIAYAAAEAFFKKTGILGGAKIRLNKRIPVGAGLAGGSGNAAAVLKGLNTLYNARLRTSELCEIGTPLGADVPYCIIGGTRLAEGIGEKISPLPKMPKCHIVLVKPRFSISTAWAYQNVDESRDLVHPNTDELIAALRKRDLAAIAANMGNVLEDVSIGHYEILRELKEKLVSQGALGALMSGSGPTVFGIFDSEEKAASATDHLREEYPSAFVCHTTTVGSDRDEQRLRKFR